MEMFQDAIRRALLVTFGKPLMSRSAWGGGGLIMFRLIAQELLNIEPISIFLIKLKLNIFEKLT
jgi:hypothetical protein